MKTLLEVIQLSGDYLEKKGVPRARREAEDLIAWALQLKRLDLYLQFDRPLIESELELCRSVIQKRGLRIPYSYITKELFFSGIRLKTDARVLIPRQETEILVDEIAGVLEKEGSLEGKVLWDVCTGSGCIGLSLKSRFSSLKVFLSDISSEALELAKENAQSNQIEVEILKGDLLEPFKGKICHFFVCNPPYISVADFNNLLPEVNQYEPRLALVGGASGYEFYERLSQNLHYFLSPHGRAWFELGDGQGETVSKLFENPYWKTPEVRLDWAKRERFLALERTALFP